jgi:acetyl-CoA/propionyl-CoA carboxylase, biotin carboxylase, biotin carboxyl carrier protein
MAIKRLLVANRGEIALRVFRTCRLLGIETVAVVAPNDRGSLHACGADTTIEVASYLDAAELVRAARDSDADAIHPGYGFLAESPAFASGVGEAGLIWVGPPPEALRLGGDKSAAKQAAEAAGVPVLPAGDPATIGFPLVVKATAGGGGRGMRIVRSATELDDALSAASREADTAFADGRVFCERFLERARHIEVQLVVDTEGHVLVLGERDCSVQRRHQKVLEESPPTGLAPEMRARLERASAAFASAIGYRNAGTVEFLVDGDTIYFLELNGRIQVEHPVTECVYGVDLVALQIRVASGDSLAAEAPEPAGHAVEVRLCAEDPRTFLPQAGRLERLHLPTGIRVDAGFEEGDEIGTSYDSLIAKLIAHADSREAALDQLAVALEETEIAGVTTNLSFLRWLVAHPELRAGEVTTAFLTEHPPLSQTPLRRVAASWRAPWRLNLPTPPVAAPPDVEAASDAVAHDAGAGGTITAPMPGTVLRVDVAPGDTVRARQTLLILEAMKMETPVSSPFAGTVTAVHVAPGDRVAGGALLVELGAPGDV